MRSVTLLSTYWENAGDDLIREGVQHQLCLILGREPGWRHVSKSNPLSIFMPKSPWAHAPVHRMRPKPQTWIKRFGRALESASPRWLDKVANADTFVIAGTPIFYFVGERSFIDIEATYGSNWPENILTRRLEVNRAPLVMALGMGSIYHGSPEEVLSNHPKAADFIRRFVDRAAVVTTRDEATDQLLHAACPGSEERIIRSICPSFWAKGRLRVPEAMSPKRVSLSFSMESVDWDLSMPRQKVIEARTRAVEWVVSYFKERAYDIGLLAHNQFDVVVQRDLAERFGLRLPTIVDARRLMEEIYRSEIVVTWRVHGALAGLAAARPVLLFKTDRRSGAAKGFGACILDDHELTREQLVGALDRLCRDAVQSPAERRATMEARLAAELEKLKAPLLRAIAPGHGE